MNLQQFLALTADVPEICLRAAMVKAIAAEPPRRSYPRFYTEVLRELHRRDCCQRRAA